LGGIDAVLLDLSSTGGDDLDAISELNSTAPNVPILLLGDTAENGLSRRAISKGAEDFLRKQDIHTDMLLRVLKNTIQRKYFRDTLSPATSRFQKLINKNPESTAASAERSSTTNCGSIFPHRSNALSISPFVPTMIQTRSSPVS
jgi:DNA-binding NarL/FixJ family response regulator